MSVGGRKEKRERRQVFRLLIGHVVRVTGKSIICVWAWVCGRKPEYAVEHIASPPSV